MSAPAQQGLTFDVSQAPREPATIITVKLHGTLTSGDAAALRELVKPLIEKGGHIQLDCTDITRIDSSGLGALVGLKVSAVHHGNCTLELVNLSPKVKELLRITTLTEYLARPDTKLY